MCTMKRLVLVLFALIAMPAMAQPAVVAPGIYTDEEKVYFEGEAGRVAPPRIGVRIQEAGNGVVWQSIDRFGMVPSSEPIASSLSIGDCVLALRSLDGVLNFKASPTGCEGCALPLVLDAKSLALGLPDGKQAALLRERPFACWMTVKRRTPKTDGSKDWLFRAHMKTHDQSGRLRIGGGDCGAPEVIIHIRNVVWPAPTRNHPSMVLYVFNPADMERAVAYGWATPGAVSIGINQCWMQASCTLTSFTLNGAE